MALVDIDTHPWLTELSACEKLYSDIHQQLAMRSRESEKTSQNYARLSANLRIRLKQYSNEVQHLKGKLEADSLRMIITSEEAERRGRQIEVLESREVQLQQLFEDRTSNIGSIGPNSRNRLFMVSQGSSRIPDSDDEPLNTQDLTVSDLRTQMRAIEQEQDNGLDALSIVISRQRQIAETIGGEVDVQNDILDELADQIDQTDSHIRRETREVSVVSRKDRTFGYWLVIILLLISIIVVWCV